VLLVGYRGDYLPANLRPPHSAGRRLPSLIVTFAVCWRWGLLDQPLRSFGLVLAIGIVVDDAASASKTSRRNSRSVFRRRSHEKSNVGSDRSIVLPPRAVALCRAGLRSSTAYRHFYKHSPITLPSRRNSGDHFAHISRRSARVAPGPSRAARPFSPLMNRVARLLFSAHSTEPSPGRPEMLLLRRHRHPQNPPSRWVFYADSSVYRLDLHEIPTGFVPHSCISNISSRSLIADCRSLDRTDAVIASCPDRPQQPGSRTPCAFPSG